MTEQKREIAKFTKQMVVCKTKTALFLGRPGRGQMSEIDAYRVGLLIAAGWLADAIMNVMYCLCIHDNNRGN